MATEVVRVGDGNDLAGWDDFVRLCPSSNPFHTRAWVESFRSERLTPLYLRVLSGNRTIGAIAGLVVAPANRILAPIHRPALLFTGPALERMDGAALRDCTLSAMRLVASEGMTGITCVGRDHPHACDWSGSRVRPTTVDEYIADLGGCWKDVESRMRNSIREQTRKAERSGLVFGEESGPRMVPQLTALLERTRSRKVGEQFSFFYLPHLSEQVLGRLAATDLARFFVARLGGNALCILLALAFNRRAYALLIGCSEEGYRLRAPAFVWLNAMKALQAAGLQSLNLSGAWPGSKLAFAKESLGAVRTSCAGFTSPYLQGPVRNLLFQIYRWRDNLSAAARLVAQR